MLAKYKRKFFKKGSTHINTNVIFVSDYVLQKRTRDDLKRLNFILILWRALEIHQGWKWTSPACQMVHPTYTEIIMCKTRGLLTLGWGCRSGVECLPGVCHPHTNDLRETYRQTDRVVAVEPSNENQEGKYPSECLPIRKVDLPPPVWWLQSLNLPNEYDFSQFAHNENQVCRVSVFWIKPHSWWAEGQKGGTGFYPWHIQKCFLSLSGENTNHVA